MTLMDILAPETKQKVLSFLPYEDLASMCLVSRTWNLEAENPGLWENYDGMDYWGGIIQLTQISDLKTLIQIKRFQKLKKISFDDGFMFGDETFRIVMKHLQNLESVDLRFCNLACINPALLTAFLGGLKETKLSRSSVTEIQKMQIFSKLEELNMLRILYWPESFVSIQPSTLATVLTCPTVPGTYLPCRKKHSSLLSVKGSAA